ncbi:MAG: FAD:protein FMN transferase [Bifidobacterium mongoliense]|jgi:thiamine biosynthesis lipoprotein|uniref:FAD:protein FMN transferase n=1 Tax=Bifidobacterium mongoliense TaxID=518643 RepID=UPI002F35EE79
MDTFVLNVMNLPFTIMLESRHRETDMHSTVDRIHEVLVDVDRRFSPFRDDSLVSRFRRGDRSMSRDQDFGEVYMRALLERVETDGLFDPYFRGGYDPTGLVKGWAVNRAFSLVLRPLLSQGLLTGAAINAGGDVLFSAREHGLPWRVGVQDPYDVHEYIAAFELGSGAVATSGTSRRGEHVVREYHDVVQATVIADSIVEADVWATALLAAPQDRLDALIRDHGLTAFLVMGPQGYRNYLHGKPAQVISTQEQNR